MPRLPLTVHRLAIAGSAAASFALAGCSESTSSPTREIAPTTASLAQDPDVIDPTGRHVFHTKPWFDNPARDARPGSGGTTNTGIYFHGGPVLLSGPKVVTIYWSSTPIYNNQPAPGEYGDPSKDASLVGDFLRRLGGSSYFKINSTYTDGGVNAIANAVNYAGTWANNTNAPSGTQNVTDADMLSMLQDGFASGAITYDPTTVYAIFTGGAVNLGSGYTSPPQYCAYHYNGTVNVGGVAKTVLYAAMPYNAQYPRYCTSGLAPANGTRDAAADFEVNTLAHEIEEATTDPLGTAWWDHRGYENADKCAWQWGKTTVGTNGGTYNVTMGTGSSKLNFLIQMNWLNTGSGGCSNGL